MRHDPPRSVLITGARGNLGTKLIAHLAEQDWCRRIVALDHEAGATETVSGTEIVWPGADISVPGPWQGSFSGVDAVIHFAAFARPSVTWDEAFLSFDMTANVGAAAVEHGVRRFVFASSNHAMGAYFADPLDAPPGWLKGALMPRPGTVWEAGGVRTDSTRYGAAKAFGERFVMTLGPLSGGRMSTVSLRIGWVQVGENRPETLTAAGTPLPPEERQVQDAEDGRTDRWFRNMWLSNRDFLDIAGRALSAAPDGWPDTGIVVNAVSNNAGMDWSLEEARSWLGYAPQDDVWRADQQSTS